MNFNLNEAPPNVAQDTLEAYESGNTYANDPTTGAFMPRILLMQPGSPQIVREGQPIFIEGAKLGDFVLRNGNDQTLLGNSITVVNLFLRVRYTVWQKFDLGGSFIGSFPTEWQAQECVKVNEGSEGPVLFHEHIVLLVGCATSADVKREPLVLGLKSSGLPCSRQFNQLVQDTPLRYSAAWKLTSETVTDTNNRTYAIPILDPTAAGWLKPSDFQELSDGVRLLRKQEEAFQAPSRRSQGGPVSELLPPDRTALPPAPALPESPEEPAAAAVSGEEEDDGDAIPF